MLLFSKIPILRTNPDTRVKFRFFSSIEHTNPDFFMVTSRQFGFKLDEENHRELFYEMVRISVYLFLKLFSLWWW